MNKLLVVCGPTSAGKTSLAIALAQKFGGEIVSADSRQVYRGMDIGTGKIFRPEPKLNIPGFINGDITKSVVSKFGAMIWPTRGVIIALPNI